MTTTEEMVRRDLSVLWHPCTQMKDHESWPPIPIRSGSGVWLEDFDGRRYIDAISSWWVNLLGHCQPDISAAIRDQLEQLEHVILAGFSHEPVVRLSEQLVRITPAGLSRCFYADNGSAAVEIAIKMSFHYWRNQGHPEKTRLMNLSNSYHGETLGALAAGDVALYKDTYAPLLRQPVTAPSPDAFSGEPGETAAELAARRADELDALLEEHAHEVCALILEPLVQCAGSMRMYHPLYLRRAREACDRHGVHLIADEIAVGFGRTGTLFACEQAGIRPDFLCLGKGLTGGFLPLSAVLCTEEIYAAFYDDYQNLRAFLHSHSYTGNPLACAAANATLDVLERERVIEANQERIRWMGEATRELRDHPHVADVRQTGMILAIEMVRDRSNREPYPWTERRGQQVYRHALSQGCLLRPLGDVIYFMPPYVINREEIATLARVAGEGIDLATRDRGDRRRG
ncbi:MAG: adenosylmethionine--8-amino-7-oxononanoate transaminase [Gammaproteobacteria bacterium]|jgi:adenosylmethionine-8-amino-7-oxononanoate aminotransferase|nr:adenosylmethionine--8-amino-7-oxononanoate transaminase [Gammaproteobacteria bacterium]